MLLSLNSAASLVMRSCSERTFPKGTESAREPISSDFTFVPQPKYTQAEWRDNLHLSASGAVRMLREGEGLAAADTRGVIRKLMRLTTLNTTLLHGAC